MIYRLIHNYCIHQFISCTCSYKQIFATQIWRKCFWKTNFEWTLDWKNHQYFFDLKILSPWIALSLVIYHALSEPRGERRTKALLKATLVQMNCLEWKRTSQHFEHFYEWSAFILLEHTMIWFLFKGDFILIWLDEIYMNF